MISKLQNIPSYNKPKSDDINRLTDRVNILSDMRGRSGLDTVSSPFGIQILGNSITSQTIKIFEVQSAATGNGTTGGDGVYNCFAQKFHSSYWVDISGLDKFVDLNATSIEVWNINENDVEATYSNALAKFDIMAAWQWTDDGGKVRWVGIPCGPSPRLAITAEPAPADTKIICNLYNRNGGEITGADLGAGIEVHCSVSGGADLDDAVPRLADNQLLFVFNSNGVWYCTTIFQVSEDCLCST